MWSGSSWTGAALQKAENENYGFQGNTGCWYMLENCPERWWEGRWQEMRVAVIADTHGLPQAGRRLI